jgi:predicted RND superfamily exporter protein
MGGILIMWFFGMTLNVSSIMTVSVSMGLVVDSTVHLLYAEKTNESVDSVFYSTIIPIILAHILLFFSFIFLCFESFTPIRDFSLGLIVLIFIGLFCDLYVLPLILKK